MISQPSSDILPAAGYDRPAAQYTGEFPNIKCLSKGRIPHTQPKQPAVEPKPKKLPDQVRDKLRQRYSRITRTRLENHCSRCFHCDFAIQPRTKRILCDVQVEIHLQA